MKSIKEYNKSNSTMQSILGQSLWYARCCILSVSLMSGFGLPYDFDSIRSKKWFDRLDDPEAVHSALQNVKILRAVYKKGDPRYCNSFNGSERDYDNYIWDDSSFKRVISPVSQSYLIMDEIMLAKYFHKCMEERYADLDNNNEKKAICIFLANSALVQSQFMSDYLRNIDGLFVPKADLSQNPFGEPYLEEEESEPAVSDQAIAMKAFSMLSESLNDTRYPLFMDNYYSSMNRRYAEEIYQVFQDSPQDIFGGKTRDLCNVISACIQYYKSHSNNNDVFNYIMELSLELESRIDMSGNLLRYPDDNKLTSNSSCFIAVSTLLEAYKLTNIYKFLSSASAIYRKLNLLWDHVNGLYLLDNDDKYKYTSRDVGTVISGLNAIRLYGDEGQRYDAQSKLISFFSNAVNSSSLIQSCITPPPLGDFEGLYNCQRSGAEDIVQGNFYHPSILQSLETCTAPVFAKKFTFKPKKHKFDINSKSFYSEYALYTACEMLQMNYPDIDTRLGEKTEVQEDVLEADDNYQLIDE